MPTLQTGRTVSTGTLAAVAVCQGAGLVGVPAVLGAMRSGWYRDLRKPSFQPPDLVFGPAWTAFYALQGLALRELWKQVDTPEGSAAVRAFATQLALNAAWAPTFFGRRSPAAGLVVIGALLPAVILTVERARRVSPKAAGLLTPYAGWIAFATLLNAAIVALNPGLRHTAGAEPRAQSRPSRLCPAAAYRRPPGGGPRRHPGRR